ncbi:hypothetical protein Ae201684P_002085 [Aphanomyces euteiches]|uniref:RRM domain-containing protein n=1 Tax=Aphanomyces euteiches TaxID=100861 RepID=A0A6G0XKQ3_9STRA|nr:hypothetical protein Ae201684_003900 [Aphanomyces euteiches]KAH9084846.1 hypothetical protein Ae201684P_002085 [Aphanomyces euteiches]KAH9133477.1 hypothetical protein AeRB84_020449 [Aphanomyces euteiches]
MTDIPKYRQRNPRRSTSDGPSRPKAYTVNEESRFVLIRNIPALGASEDLVAQCRKYGQVEDFRMEDDHDDASQYIDVMWLQYATVDAARQAKAFLAKTPFLGNILQLSYCPQDEQPADTRAKLDARRELLQNRFNLHQRRNPPPEMIGPRLPSRDHALPKAVRSENVIVAPPVAPTLPSAPTPAPAPPKRRRI